MFRQCTLSRSQSQHTPLILARLRKKDLEIDWIACKSAVESLLTQHDDDPILFGKFCSFPPVFDPADQWNKEHASRNDSRTENRPTFYFRHVSSRRPHAPCCLCVHMSTELPHPIFLIRKQAVGRLYLRRTGANRRVFHLTGDTCPAIKDRDKPPPQD